MEITSPLNDDQLYTAIATLALVELAKRLPNEWVPLKAENANDIKLVAGLVSLFVSAFRMWQTGQFVAGNLKASAASLIQVWLVGWFFAHTAYKVTPYLKKEAPVEEKEAQGLDQ